MPTYLAPATDIKFLLNRWLKLGDYGDLPGFEDLDSNFVDAVVDGMARFAENVTFPINMSGDQQGCQWEDGAVTAPDGFKEAYKSYSDDGWFSLSSGREHGGQGLPETLGFATTEMLIASNVSFSMFTGLNKGAIELLENFGTPEQQSLYLPKLNSGEWNATMDLTEGHAGTDLGLMRTKAELQQDGTFRISGTKIFISSGEHDLAENIVHMVLARIPGSPPGAKGISLFIVPKFRIDSDGNLGDVNGVHCESIEEKMGLHGSSTCVMCFDQAIGHLVGPENGGMRAMFTMMNATRLFVGIQGVAIADAAYQNAADYARERLQGRAPDSTTAIDSADRIIDHPDVRRMLLFCRSFTEGGRALCYWTGLQLDISNRHPDAATREEAAQITALLTPVVKAYCSDMAEIATSTALQCFGGHGYVVETGMEQYLRDVRVSRIFEGANGIQAMDLVGRKLLANGGRSLRLLLGQIDAFCQLHDESDALHPFVSSLQDGVTDLKRATNWLLQAAVKSTDVASAVAVNYLTLLGTVSVGYMWSQIAAVCAEDNDDAINGRDFCADKLITGRFFMENMMPDTKALTVKIEYGAETIMAMSSDSF